MKSYYQEKQPQCLTFKKLLRKNLKITIASIFHYLYNYLKWQQNKILTPHQDTYIHLGFYKSNIDLEVYKCNKYCIYKGNQLSLVSHLCIFSHSESSGLDPSPYQLAGSLVLAQDCSSPTSQSPMLLNSILFYSILFYPT